MFGLAERSLTIQIACKQNVDQVMPYDHLLQAVKKEVQTQIIDNLVDYLNTNGTATVEKYAETGRRWLSRAR